MEKFSQLIADNVPVILALTVILIVSMICIVLLILTYNLLAVVVERYAGKVMSWFEEWGED